MYCQVTSEAGQHAFATKAPLRQSKIQATDFATVPFGAKMVQRCHRHRPRNHRLLQPTDNDDPFNKFTTFYSVKADAL